MSRHLPYGGMPLLERLGVSFQRAEDGRAEGTWSPINESCNPNGGVQGGLFGTVFDAAMSMAIHSALPPEDSCVSLELKASTPGGGRAGDTLRIEARVLRLGGTAIFAEASATRDGELVATGNGTFLRRRKPPRPARASE
jgi:uncharacterized protein (TIGR00369 family)